MEVQEDCPYHQPGRTYSFCGCRMMSGINSLRFLPIHRHGIREGNAAPVELQWKV